MIQELIKIDLQENQKNLAQKTNLINPKQHMVKSGKRTKIKKIK
jgi:hypothetical protein